MLLTEGNAEEALGYCRRKLEPLYLSDQWKKTDYIRTLKVYLEHNNDLVHSARELYIHRNTMLNRIRKIAELLETDINDPAVRAELYMVYQILDCPAQTDVL